MELETSNRRKIGKLTKLWKLNSIFLNQWIKEEIREIRKYFETNENETQHSKTYGMSESGA